LKPYHRRSKKLEFVDPEFMEALEENSPRGRWHDRHAQRKTWQFCRQVQRALNLSLADRDLFVEEVVPAPDCGRLVVQVSVPPDRSVADAIGELRRDAARLRAEVAAAITRKRAPELSFIPAVLEGGHDD
jgi:ribosome-binding factor A